MQCLGIILYSMCTTLKPVEKKEGGTSTHLSLAIFSCNYVRQIGGRGNQKLIVFNSTAREALYC